MSCLDSVCQCVSGTILQDDQCVQGKKNKTVSTHERQPDLKDFFMRHSLCFLPAQVFPGELHFESEDYKPEMANRSSNVFVEKAKEIENEVSFIFLFDA